MAGCGSAFCSPERGSEVAAARFKDGKAAAVRHPGPAPAPRPTDSSGLGPNSLDSQRPG